MRIEVNPIGLYQHQRGAVLVVGLIMLMVLMTAASVGSKNAITMEQVSGNMTIKNNADNSAESTVIMALNDDTVILPLITEVRTSGQTVEDNVSFTLPGTGTRTGDANIKVSVAPTVGFSVDELTTFYIEVSSESEVMGTSGAVSQSFLRLAVSED